jgi:exonuclease III
MVQKINLSLTSLNMHFFNFGKETSRTEKEVIEELLKEDSAFICLQEFGKKSRTGDLNGTKIETGLEEKGYSMLKPAKGGRVEARLFYKLPEGSLVNQLPPIYADNYLNRQCGATFIVDDNQITVYSLYLPTAYSADPSGKRKDNTMEKQEYWDKILEYAAGVQDEKVILAGDFNESPIAADGTNFPKKIQTLMKTFSEIEEHQTWNKRNLDHVFVSPALKKDAIRETATDTLISDHKKLVLEFTL